MRSLNLTGRADTVTPPLEQMRACWGSALQKNGSACARRPNSAGAGEQTSGRKKHRNIFNRPSGRLRARPDVGT
jgi:hypothetical protein